LTGRNFTGKLKNIDRRTSGFFAPFFLIAEAFGTLRVPEAHSVWASGVYLQPEYNSPQQITQSATG
jgi:hypothetical protein